MQVEATRYYRVKALALMWDVSPATVYRLAESGVLEAVRIGTGKGAIRISGEAVNAYLLRVKQLDGLACVACGADFTSTRVAHVPVGRSATGSQVFACVEHPGHEVMQALFVLLGAEQAGDQLLGGLAADDLAGEVA